MTADTQAPASVLPRLSIGDRVRVIARLDIPYPHRFPIGYVGVVEQVFPNGDVDLGEWACRRDEVELVGAETAAPAPAPTGDMRRDLIIEMCKAHDREDAAQKGEPSPWEVDGAESDETFVGERTAAMGEALDVAIAALEPVTPPVSPGDMVLVPRSVLDPFTQSHHAEPKGEFGEYEFADDDPAVLHSWSDNGQVMETVVEITVGDFRRLREAVAAAPAQMPAAVSEHYAYLAERIIDLFDKDETAGSFLREDGEGGFASGVYRMAREIDRLRAAAPSPSASTMGRLPRHTGDGGWTLPPLWLADIRKEAAAAEEWAGQIALEGVEAIALVVERRVQSCLSSAGGEETAPIGYLSRRALAGFDPNGSEIIDAIIYPNGTLRPDQGIAIYAAPPKAETETDTITDATVADIMAGIEIPIETASERERLVEALRDAGWMVAVHNDYRLNGEAHTFWLWTHPDGRWVKGEGRTDAEALVIAARAALAQEPAR